MNNIYKIFTSLVVLLSLFLASESFSAVTANEFRSQTSQPLSITGTNLSKKRGLDIAIPTDYRDAFGRLRVSEQLALFYSTNVYYNTNTMVGSTTGAGASIAHLPNESAVALTVGTPNGERALRQSFIYVPYVPGKSQLVTITGVIGTAKTNNVRRIGLFDDSDGLFFQVDSNGPAVVLRSSVSGSVVEQVIYQNDWNIDKLDGSGVYRKNVDLSKSQIFIIDYQWLGVGRVRFGLDIDGEITYIHEFLNADIIDTVYMHTGTLPIRFENVNTGITASPTVLKELCGAVAAEGTYAPPVFEFTMNSGVTPKTVSTRALVGAVRMKSSFAGEVNRKSVFLQGMSALVTASTLFESVKCMNPSAITATWVSAGTLSAAEYSTDISAITCGSTINIDSFWVAAGNNRAASDCPNCTLLTNPNRLIGMDIAGTTSQVLLFYATSQSGNADVHRTVKWIEYF